MSSLRRLILTGIRWNYVGAILRTVTQLGIIAILARLLTPEEFGIAAIAMIVIRFGGFFADFGVAGALQQRAELDQSHINAAFILSLLMGSLFCVLGYFLAEPAAVFFEKPESESAIRWLSFGFLLSALAAVSKGLIRREFQFLYLSLAETISYLIGYGLVATLLAYRGFGYMSLVWAHLAQATSLLLMVYWKTKHKASFRPREISANEIISFGGRYSLINFLNFIGANLDHMIIAKFYPASIAGFWSRARSLISMPVYQLIGSISTVLFPAFAKMQADHSKLRRAYLDALLAGGLIVFPISAGAAVAASELIAVLLGSQWKESVPLLQLAALFLPAEMLSSISASLISAMGRVKRQLHIQFSLVALLISIALVLAPGWEPDRLIWLFVGYYWLRLVLYGVEAAAATGLRTSDHLPVIATVAGASLFAATGVYSSSILLSELNLALQLLFEVVGGALGLALFYLVARPKPIVDGISRLLQGKALHPAIHWLLFRKGDST
jgi:O-antigen/teichoic acid export membrane protein